MPTRINKGLEDSSTKNKIFSIKIVVPLLIAAFLLFYNFNQKKELSEYKETQALFGSYVTIHCLYDEREDILGVVEEGWRRLKEIQISMNALSVGGYVARINKSGYDGVQVSDDVYRLLKRSLEFSDLTRGAFDITVFPLVELWKNAARSRQFPDETAVTNVKKKVGYQNLKLKNDNIVSFKVSGMKIDLGAIAKGYAVDEVVKIFTKNKIKNFYIDAGGDIYCGGKYKKKKKWTVGVQDPRNKTKIIDVLRIEDAAVTTSGNYERFISLNGKKYSHIIDPVTGYPQDGVISSTVIAPTAEKADALSTALSVMGGKKGIKLINSLSHVEAMIIEDKGGKLKKYRSKGYKKLKK